MPRFFKHTLIVLMGLGGITLFAAQAYAGAMTVQATGTETGSYASNPLLTTSGTRSLWGSTTEPELFFKDATPTSSLSADTKIDQNIFNISAYNSTDGHETAAFTTSNERWKFSLGGQGDYDTTRTSEITTFGLAPAVVRHTGLAATPQISYAPDAANVISLAGSVASSTYHDRLFTDYENFSAAPTYTHTLDPRNAVFVSLQAQRYQTTSNTNTQINSVAPLIGWQATFTPRLTGNASIGAQTTREFQSGIATSPWTAEYIFAAGLSFAGIQDAITLTANRQQFPYGNGTEALQTGVSLTEAHALNSLFSLNGGGAYQTSSYPVVTPGAINTFAKANAGATYHMTDHVDLTASYQYRYETLIGTSVSAHDNAAMLALAYHPKLLTFH